MSNSANWPRPDTDESDDGQPFGGEDVLPFEKQRRVHQFLTQETRYHIIQTLLGHPAHLATLDELDYFVPKSRTTIREHLDELESKHLVTDYPYEGDANAATDPTKFWGFTSYGIVLLNEYDYLRYVPVLRVLQDHVYMTEKITRHRNAVRPSLPDDVVAAFETEPVDDEMTELIETAFETRETTRLFDAPPIDPPATADGDRPIDDLF